MIIKGIITPETKLSDLNIKAHDFMGKNFETVQDLIDDTVINTTCKFYGGKCNSEYTGEYTFIEPAILGDHNDKACFLADAIKIGDKYANDTEYNYGLYNFGPCSIYRLVWYLPDEEDAENSEDAEENAYWEPEYDPADHVNWEFPDDVELIISGNDDFDDDF